MYNQLVVYVITVGIFLYIGSSGPSDCFNRIRLTMLDFSTGSFIQCDDGPTEADGVAITPNGTRLSYTLPLRIQ